MLVGGQKLAARQIPLTCNKLSSNIKPFIQFSTRHISLAEAKQVLREENLKVNTGSASSPSWNSKADLKKLYLSLVKIYHPDVAQTGNHSKFQKI